MGFVCNVCGASCERPAEFGRELANCAGCGSTVRLRAIAALLSEEIFGVVMALPEFPALKGIRGIGMSDSEALASRLAEKFDYTNTFYHQSPRFDVTRLEERDRGRYDFILSSEVLEHVPPPVDAAFATLHSMLKPDGLLLMTVPYCIGGRTAEHFPDLYEYSLAAPGGRAVLVNRRRDGSIEVFDHLTFHGGHGSTLEMRVFTEESLRGDITRAGFDSVHFAAECRPEFGVEHAEAWSLPIAARKAKFRPPAAELAQEYREAFRRANRIARDLESLKSDYERHAAHHQQAVDQWKRDAEQSARRFAELEAAWQERTEWAKQLERESHEALAAFHRANAAETQAQREVQELVQHVERLEREKDEAIAEFRRVEASESEAWRAVETLSERLKQVTGEIDQLRKRKWVRLGRKLGVVG